MVRPASGAGSEDASGAGSEDASGAAPTRLTPAGDSATGQALQGVEGGRRHSRPALLSHVGDGRQTGGA